MTGQACAVCGRPVYLTSATARQPSIWLHRGGLPADVTPHAPRPEAGQQHPLTAAGADALRGHARGGDDAVTAKPRVCQQDGSTYVIGTSDVQVAIGLAGITPETHRWSGTGYGLYARRQGRWRHVSDYLRPPKDARPGVAFYGPITERGSR